MQVAMMLAELDRIVGPSACSGVSPENCSDSQRYVAFQVVSWTRPWERISQVAPQERAITAPARAAGRWQRGRHLELRCSK
eukprot:5236994-Pyramimonas_sp.AAC.1